MVPALRATGPLACVVFSLMLQSAPKNITHAATDCLRMDVHEIESKTRMSHGPDPIDAFLNDTCALLQRLDRGTILRARDLLLDCHREQGRVFTVGNGGSASTAQHFACDLAKFVIPPGERPFETRCLTDNVSLYTAWANDAERADVFVNLMRGLIRPGDVLIACSVHGGKGFSADLVRAVRFANESGAKSLSLVGFDGGALHRESTVSILVPADSTPQVEGIHLVIEHLLMSLIKQGLGGILDER
jgi:D-sedoheptulose 7-phosphate isomerase